MGKSVSTFLRLSEKSRIIKDKAKALPPIDTDRSIIFSDSTSFFKNTTQPINR